MPNRLSHAHWRVQTRTRAGGWVTRAHTTIFHGAVAVANRYGEDLHTVARVVLNGVVFYMSPEPPVAKEAGA